MRIWEDITLPLYQRQLDYLNYTIEYYTTQGNIRSIDLNGGCYYMKGEGCKCAIGKDLPDDLCKELDSAKYKDTTIDNNLIFKQLPFTIKSLGQRFLSKIQDLHDTDEYWINLNLSERGLEHIEFIKDVYINPKN